MQTAEVRGQKDKTISSSQPLPDLAPSDQSSQFPGIGDYALIGDSRSAALISRDGSIDWLCLPRFDSPSIFGAILDAHHGGRFQIRPTGQFRSERRYLPETNVLETIFRTATGAVYLRDLMPVASEEEKRKTVTPSHQILRELEGFEGEIELEILYEPRPNYGKDRPLIRARGALGFWCEAQHAALTLRSEVPLTLESDRHSVHGIVRIHAGERKFLSFSFADEAPAVVPALGETAHAQLHRTIRWWRNWASRCSYVGPYRDAVVRSALTLKLMTYAPSGAVIAAPTTSLPEYIGGERNWDYRYCWLRDSSLTLEGLFSLGYDEEAVAFLGWILHATRLTWPELQVLYDVFGEANLPESELDHLAGHANSHPVRIGNDAHSQLQMDVYGEVVDAVFRFVRHGGRLDGDARNLLSGIGHTVCKRWREPDEGIWEGRSGRFHHTHSKAMCWVALDRLVQLHEGGQIDIDIELFRTERDAIRQDVETHGYNTQLDSYTSIFNDDKLDAALLTLPLYGYIDGAHPRMRATCARVREHLARGPLVYRYLDTDDGLPPGEGAFGICSFWAVECLARGGDVEQATVLFEQLLTYANDVGLLAEEFDPDTGIALGNFPQAFSHVGLINAALTLAKYRGEQVVRLDGHVPADFNTEDR